MAAGTDLNCGGAYSSQLPHAFAQGLVTEAMLRQAAGRAVYGWLELGLFEDTAAAAADARRAATRRALAANALALKPPSPSEVPLYTTHCSHSPA